MSDTSIDLVGGGNGGSNSGVNGGGTVTSVGAVVQTETKDLHSDMTGIAFIVIGIAVVTFAVVLTLRMFAESDEDRKERLAFERALADADFKPSEIESYFENSGGSVDPEIIDDVMERVAYEFEDDEDFTVWEISDFETKPEDEEK